MCLSGSLSLCFYLRPSVCSRPPLPSQIFCPGMLKPRMVLTGLQTFSLSVLPSARSGLSSMHDDQLPDSHPALVSVRLSPAAGCRRLQL